MSETIESLTQELKTVYAKMAQKSEQLWTKRLKDFMKQYPEVKALNWKQYTPSWNDGDACTFSVGTLNLLLQKDFEKEDYEEAELFNLDSFSTAINSWDNSKPKKLSADLWQSFRDLAKLMDKNEETLEYAFGDGASVVVTAEGIKVEEYYDE